MRFFFLVIHLVCFFVHSLFCLYSFPQSEGVARFWCAHFAFVSCIASGGVLKYKCVEAVDLRTAA